MTVLIIFTIVSLILAIAMIYGIIQMEKETKVKKQELHSFNDNIYSKLGSCTLEINTSNNFYKDIQHTIMVYDNYKLIIIYGRQYNYTDILDFNINNEVSYKTSTSTGSMVGRAIVGGVLSGGVGAVIGGTTAKQNTKSSITKYKINISMRDMANPVITVETSLEDICNKLISVLKNIIDQNERTE